MTPSDQCNEWLSRPACSVSQFAEMFGLSRNAAYEAVGRGEVQAVRIGKRIVVPTAPLRKLLMLEVNLGEKPIICPCRWLRT